MDKIKIKSNKNDPKAIIIKRGNDKYHARFIREFFHHSMMRGHGSRVNSKIENDNLVVQLVLPGVKKSSISVRAKRNKIEINAVHKEDVFVFPHSEAHKIFDLEHRVIPENGEAVYTDGILTVTFKLAEPPLIEGKIS